MVCNFRVGMKNKHLFHETYITDVVETEVTVKTPYFYNRQEHGHFTLQVQSFQ